MEEDRGMSRRIETGRSNLKLKGNDEKTRPFQDRKMEHCPPLYRNFSTMDCFQTHCKLNHSMVLESVMRNSQRQQNVNFHRPEQASSFVNSHLINKQSDEELGREYTKN